MMHLTVDYRGGLLLIYNGPNCEDFFFLQHKDHCKFCYGANTY